ncbi:MAG: 4'-phosphopantetheinyl transferase superfamily protein [Clostridia bacterium]|nr:4'-phosphopantetheinyl transferase superfamily protein [Clostridia bacterium]
MALKTFILENSSTKRQRQSDIQKAVREYLNNPKIKVEYDEKGRPTLVNTEKKMNISVTCCGKVMLVVLFEKAIGIDGEYLPDIVNAEKKIDHMTIAERFFSYDEIEYLRDSSRETELDNFIKIWVRKEAYVKAAGKTVAEFPNFSVVDGARFVKKIHSIAIKTFAIKFEDCENYTFAIAGIID